MFAHGPSELWNALQWVGTHSLCALGGFFIGFAAGALITAAALRRSRHD